MLTSKIITEIIENYSELSGCPNSCNKLFQVDLDKPWNYLWYCYEKAPPPPLHHFWKDRGANAPACLYSLASLCILFYTPSLYSLLAAMCHCNEHKLAAVSWDRAVQNCKNIPQRVKTGE